MRLPLTAKELAESYSLYCLGKQIPTEYDEIQKFFMNWFNQFRPIATVTIPRYTRSFKASEEMRASYYMKGKGKKLPSQYCDKIRFKAENLREPDNINYFWKPFPVVEQKVKKMVDFLVDKDGNRVIANPNQVGKPRIININGQDIYNGFISKHQRNKLMSAIKDQFMQYASSCPQIKQFPIMIEVEVWDVPVDTEFSRSQDWDLGNRIFPYNKAFEDTLTYCKIIPDDSIWYVTGPPAPLFYPIEKTEDRKLVYKFYHDTRKIVQENSHYQQKLT